MPREQIFTPELQSEYCAMIRVGCSRRRAARLLGINESTIRMAMTRDEAFLNRVHRSESHREAIALDHVRNAAEKHWRAGAWLLERINPAEFGKRRHIEVTRDDVAIMFKEFAGAVMNVLKNPDDRRAVVEKLEKISIAVKLHEDWADGALPDDLGPQRRDGDWLESLLDDDEDAPPNEPSRPAERTSDYRHGSSAKNSFSSS